jgi:hypothetical protein
MHRLAYLLAAVTISYAQGQTDGSNEQAERTTCSLLHGCA